MLELTDGSTHFRCDGPDGGAPIVLVHGATDIAEAEHNLLLTHPRAVVDVLLANGPKVSPAASTGA